MDATFTQKVAQDPSLHFRRKIREIHFIVFCEEVLKNESFEFFHFPSLYIS